MENLLIVNNESERRYELEVEGDLAVAQYRLTADSIAFLHTEVPERLEGRGLGTQLIRFALDDARARDLVVVPYCPFVSAYIERNPEYLACVEASHRERLRTA